jgi:polar amino acid transport system permease protein
LDWDWSFVAEIMPTLLAGVVVTIEATLMGSALALTAGLAFAIASRTRHATARRLIGFLLDFVRGTPLLVQLYFLFYILPDLGITLSPLAAGTIGLGLHYATYTAVVYRAGIDNVSKGQWEAAKACNLTMAQTWRHVIVPQAIPPMIPALANYLVAMLKETPLLSAITVVELMNQARSVANFNYRYLEPMTLVGVFFLAISIPSVLLLRWLERRFGRIG